MPARRLGQISATYRGRPLAKGGGSIGKLAAGDLVPDIPLAGGRLYDLLDMSTLTLLVSGCEGRIADSHAPWDGIAVREVSLPADVARGPAWLLVRPDGYLAAAGGPGDGHRLNHWLQRWFLPAANRRHTARSSTGARKFLRLSTIF